VFRQEGARSLSLGLAPLVNVVQDPEHPNGLEKLMNFVYEHLNACYGFKSLYQAKENYSPTSWLPQYYAWIPRVPTPEMFYAIVRIQNKQGVLDFAKSYFKFQREKRS